MLANNTRMPQNMNSTININIDTNWFFENFIGKLIDKNNSVIEFNGYWYSDCYIQTFTNEIL